MKNNPPPKRRSLGPASPGSAACMFLLQIIVMFESLMQLTHSEAFFAPYLLVYALGFLAAVSLYISESRLAGSTALPARERRLCYIGAGFFTVLISGANYPLWLEYSLGASTPAVLRAAYGVVMLACISGGCFFVFHSIFRFLALHPQTVTWRQAPEGNIPKPRQLFFLSFFAIAGVYLLVLFLIKYPGLIEADTVEQFRECLTGAYSNRNPLLSTLVIEPFVAVGMALFHDINACAAMYFTAQAIFVAFAFACVVKTLAELKAPRWLLIGSILFYALMPYHIMFSIGHSKDVLFSVSITLFCLALFRLLKSPKAPKRAYVFLFAASVGFCMMRNNGILAFAFFLPVYFFVFKKENRQIALVLLLSVLVCIVVKRPMLNALGIPQSDLFESLSLPTQQIARTVIDHDDLTREEYAVLNPIMEVEKLSETYNPGLSDPIKRLIRQTTQDNPLSMSQKLAFGKLWFALGLRHPVTYLKAFVDITCGYWNSGYPSAPWCNFLVENDLGLHLTKPVPLLNLLFDRYVGAYDDFFVLQLMICTGLFVWVYLLAGWICLLRKDKLGGILCVPVLCVAQTLILGVPVACDLRYIYCAFCGLPFVLALSTRPEPTDYHRQQEQ